MEELACAICDKPLIDGFHWTDIHRIAKHACGAPYRMVLPELQLLDTWIPTVRRFWAETHSDVCPGAYDFGVRTTSTDAWRTWTDWFAAHADELPPREAPYELR